MKKKKKSIRYGKWGQIFILPFFIIYFIFSLIPLADTVRYSFYEYYRSGIKEVGPNFVGMANYISLLNEEIPKWKAQGADVYIVAVGQVTKDPYVTNEEIEDFNARMKKEVAGAKYADLYSYLKKQGYKTTDGTHYDNETTWKIYRYLMSFVS